MKKMSFFEKADWLYTPAFKDLFTICILAIGAIILAQVLPLARAMSQPLQNQQKWLIEQIATVPTILAMALAFYSSRRWRELRYEIFEHKKTAIVLRERSVELQKATNMAEEANKAKSVFLANISHELRTPLHSILSFANFGIKKNGSVEAGKILDYFKRIHQGGETLLQLVNDLLDLSKFNSGKMEMNPQWTDLDVLISVVVEEFKSIASEKNLSIQYNQPDFECKVKVDSEKIKQVLRNLLSNAVKFTPENGKIEIAVHRKEESVSVSVRDSGVGIFENELETIFEKFIQSSKTKNGAGGTGLGLAICREIINASNGYIWAENNTAEGATFIFELPWSEQAEVQEKLLVGAG